MKLRLLDWNKQCEEDIKNGTGFLVTNPTSITKDRNRTSDGIYSPLFGTELSKEYEHIQEYSCECKELKGILYNGQICPKCGTVVKYDNSDIEKTGWIPIYNDLYLINPIFFTLIAKIIGPKNLNNILQFSNEIDKEGFVINELTEKDMEKNPYFNKGMIYFKENFNEILDYFYNKAIRSADKRRSIICTYKFIHKHINKVFINRIPVFSLILRPILIIDDTVIIADINKKYAGLITNTVLLNKDKTKIDKKPLKILPIMYQSQVEINELHSLIINLITKKEGHIRSNMLGVRTNFSSRCVIIPLVGRYKLNEVIVPYVMFMELYKFEIINLISRFDKITLNQAIIKWNKGLQEFDKRIYLIMQHLIKNTKNGLRIISNRNPTLCWGSISILHIVDVKKNYNDLTVSLPIATLRNYNADFDGDVLNFISIKDKEIADELEKVFSPYSMLLDANNGRFNRNMQLLKDQLVGLEAFCNN